MRSSYLASGSALIAIGLVMLVYTIPIVSNAAASNGPVFSEAGVPQIKSSAMALVPIELAGIAPLVAGIALVGASIGKSQPEREDVRRTRTTQKTRKTESADTA